MNLDNNELTVAEQGDKFEGDMILDERIASSRKKRNAWQGHVWPFAWVPIEIAREEFSNYELAVIENALEGFRRYTCVNFVPRTNEENYVKMERKVGCYATVGYGSERQAHMSLGSGCHVTGIIQHELMHVLSFDHEQNRSDRDNFIIIHWSNIKRQAFSNFKIMESVHVNPYLLNTDYDYGSVLHYSRNTFAKSPSLTTIEPLENEEIGQRVHMSHQDTQEINVIYGCRDFAPKDPEPIDEPETPAECNFDTNFCGWTQDYRKFLNFSQTFLTDDDFDWLRIKEGTPTEKTGPESDVSGTGHYLVIESSFPRVSGDVARIRAPFIPVDLQDGAARLCLQFYYHMKNQVNGFGTETLRVYGRSREGEQVKIWERQGHQGSDWVKAEIRLRCSVGEIQFIFEATRGDDQYGDSGLDQFRVIQGGCDQQ